MGNSRTGYNVCGLSNHTQENFRLLKTINFIQGNARQSSSESVGDDNRNVRTVHTVQSATVDENSE